LFQLADEEEGLSELDFGSPEINEYVLLRVGTTLRFIDVMNQSYMSMLLSETFPNVRCSLSVRCTSRRL